jgi:enoyl-CoA hydratase
MCEDGAQMGEELRYERAGAAAVMTIDRPQRRNAIDAAAAAGFRAALREFEADEGARVLVLTGAGGEAFCAGADLKAMDLDVDHPDGPMGPTRLIPAKPAIAAVDGWCLAGGVELALWCDLRIATPRSTFGLFERRWGVPLLDGGTQRLPRTIGMGRALELILTGRPVAAEEALRIGLVNGVHDPVLDRAREVAQLLEGKSPVALRVLKHLANRALGGDHAENLDAEAGSFGELFASEDAREGLIAFVEKRSPNFAGR